MDGHRVSKAMTQFEGSYRGDPNKIGRETRLECGVCWWVYDPREGDQVWQIEPGTAFNDLPDYWRCPNCDGAKEQFMVLPDEPTD